MLLTLLLTLAMAAPPTSPPPTLILCRQDVKMAAEIGEMTWIVLDTRDTLLVPTSLLTVTQDGDLMLADSNVLRSTYTDTSGISHTVETDCRRYASQQACATAHAAMLTQMRALFPLPPRGP